ncbi:tRNA (5-methylaminomethyl-2-thiouridine)(34)-methyltransferase MnmD [Flavobacterium sp.]|uniref:tRNA (5-methylaminomethyl-2-thiouridine)(34)-methyltransferase MnmD n=1 Tax=Flavobacterium sp. TaxID=239 RepID=UPI002A8284E5|nr:tRNA (5-methylaminomethyl-2-thiouridine)(34)-methyltransferase MnmD [Flavobacterium sp.]
MKREIIITSDGSSTIYIPEWNESYHSKNGAIQEAYHVFINAGYSLVEKQSINILEIGFGTGLNAFITYLEAKKSNTQINYVGVEAYPVSEDEVNSLNYIEELNAKIEKDVFSLMHDSKWDEGIEISSQFKLTKRKQLFQEINDIDCFDLIYFDAFGFTLQPELWSEEIFQSMYDSLLKNGILVTYACRGSIKRAMLKAGFKVEKLPGAPGKREMIRGIKV